MSEDITQEMVNDAIETDLAGIIQSDWSKHQFETPPINGCPVRAFGFENKKSSTIKGMLRLIKASLAKHEGTAAIVWRKRPSLSISNETGDDEIAFRFAVVDVAVATYVGAIHKAEQQYAIDVEVKR